MKTDQYIIKADLTYWQQTLYSENRPYISATDLIY